MAIAMIACNEWLIRLETECRWAAIACTHTAALNTKSSVTTHRRANSWMISSLRCVLSVVACRLAGA